MYTLVMINSVLSIAMLMVSSSMWGSFYDGVDSGLLVKLAELWIKTVILLLGLGVDPVVLWCSSVADAICIPLKYIECLVLHGGSVGGTR